MAEIAEIETQEEFKEKSCQLYIVAGVKGSEKTVLNKRISF